MQYKRIFPIRHLLGIIKNNQINLLYKDARSGLNFTAFWKSTQFGLLWVASLGYRLHFCANTPRSRARKSKQTSASFKRRSIVRRKSFACRWDTGRRSVDIKIGAMRNRNLKKAAKFDVFLGHRKMQHARGIFLEWVDLMVFDDGQQHSNWKYRFTLNNYKS